MAYNLKIERYGANSRRLMDDLKESLTSGGFRLDEYRDIAFNSPQTKTRGKELFVRRGNSYFSFGCSPYSDIFSTDLTQEASTASRNYTGTFGVFSNTSYDQNLNFYEQPSNKSGNSVGNGCLIPYDDYFNYELFSDKRGLNWFIHVFFEDANGDIIRTYAFWGAGQGTVPANNNNGEGFYTIGSLHLGATFYTATPSAGYHVDPLTVNTNLEAFPQHPLMQDGNENYNIYYKDNLDVIVPNNAMQANTTTEKDGAFSNRNFNYIDSIFNGSFNEFLGITPLMRFEIFVPKFTTTEMKRIATIPTGVIKQEAAEHGEIRIVEGMKTQFFTVMRKKDGQDFNTDENYSFGLWIERGL